jgi:hypothetical protein
LLLYATDDDFIEVIIAVRINVMLRQASTGEQGSNTKSFKTTWS